MTATGSPGWSSSFSGWPSTWLQNVATAYASAVSKEMFRTVVPMGAMICGRSGGVNRIVRRLFIDDDDGYRCGHCGPGAPRLSALRLTFDSVCRSIPVNCPQRRSRGASEGELRSEERRVGKEW